MVLASILFFGFCDNLKKIKKDKEIVRLMKFLEQK